MPMPIWLILLITGLYIGALFAMAWRRDRTARDEELPPAPMIYALALGVYCTSWTYFGAVGTAASSGWDYLPIYLGPALVFVLLPGLLTRIGDIVKREGISSLSDFLSARYGKSQSLAALATCAAVAGSLPYIALQLKAVGMSFSALASHNGQAAQPVGETVLLTAIALAVFAILFGTRQSDTTRHNAGLMQILAIEAVFKLAALIAVGVLSLALITGSEAKVNVAAVGVFSDLSLSGRFMTITLLSMAAIMCLPRQFHVAMIERRGAKDMARARWVFPLYMFATSIVVIPITTAGLSILPAGSPADLFVLDLPLSQGNGLLAILVFLGGFSAATGMVVVSTVALSTMVTNDLIVPSIMGRGRFDRLGDDAGHRLILIRRLVIVGLLLLAYAYYQTAGSSAALAQIGLLSFAAAVQFAPALIGAVYWRGGRRLGALTGLGAGTLVWAYTLFLPAIIGSETMAVALPSSLNPHALFGYDFDDSLTHGVVWSLLVNISLFIGVSLASRERLRDRVQAAAFVGGRREGVSAHTSDTSIARNVTPDGLRALATRFLNGDAVDHAFAALANETGIETRGDNKADWRLVQRTERLLATALGASSARIVLASAIGGMDVGLPDVLAMLDSQTQAERFDRHMLQSMLENISEGISVVDQDQKLVAWNSAYVELFDYPPELVRVGEPVANLIEHNLAQGWITGDPAEEARRRISHMRSGKPHAYERQNPDGRFLRIIGRPMPGGGYVTTFADITEDKQREQDLIEANETLESRVKDRTSALEELTLELDSARRDAEGANASKTRFLAAASHDLLQPLNAARLFLGALRSRPDASPEILAELVSKADKSIQSADDLLKGLLDISRLDHGAIKARPVILPLGPLLEDLVDEAEPMARKAGLSLSVVPTSLSVHADPDFLKSVLRNFLSNARRYTIKGGVVVGARRRGEQVRIDVWDTGPGIPENRLALVFEEFRRFEDVDNLGVRGAGLGLSVTSRLASLMGAKLEVTSLEGRGSRFSVTLPRASGTRPSGPVALSSSAEHSIDLTGLRVCCLDDEASILEGMSRLLQTWGCTVHTISNPTGAIEILRLSRFDVLIADLDLGAGMDGLDVVSSAGQVLSDPANITLLTAKGAGDALNRAYDFGIPVLHKPVNPDDLRRFLEKCMARCANHATE